MKIAFGFWNRHYSPMHSIHLKYFFAMFLKLYHNITASLLTFLHTHNFGSPSICPRFYFPPALHSSLDLAAAGIPSIHFHNTCVLPSVLLSVVVF